MKPLTLLILFFLLSHAGNAQTNPNLRAGATAEKNLAAIANVSPGTTGGLGIDERYSGVKGSPRLFDTLMNSFVKIKDEDIYITIDADIDVEMNRIIFRHPATKIMMWLPAGSVEEILVPVGESEKVFRTTEAFSFEKPPAGLKFCQVLYEGQQTLIMIPGKIFREADYRNIYSADRRYDEFETTIKYYITGRSGELIQVKLTESTLIRLFPEKKDQVRQLINAGTSPEDIAVKLLKQKG
ncbi:MAG: hypothetical protein FJY11_05215 [Bacteroidetes bacterium]|nr:hypothetical protein [Bacteroidota bacterium]